MGMRSPGGKRDVAGRRAALACLGSQEEGLQRQGGRQGGLALAIEGILISFLCEVLSEVIC